MLSIEHNLSGYLLQFFRHLRTLDFLIGIKETEDAFQAIQSVNIMNQNEFKWALKIVLVSSKEEEELFEQAFNLFFVKPIRNNQRLLHYHSEENKAEVISHDNLGEKMEPIERDLDNEQETSRKKHLAELQPSVLRFVPFDESSETEAEEVETPLWSATRRFHHTNRKAIVRTPAEEISYMEEAVKQFLNNIKLKQSRRLKNKRNGHVINLQGTLRKSFQTGTEPIHLLKKGPKKDKADFVLICDTSRSMAAASKEFLQFAYALTEQRKEVEVFLFSNDLIRVTDALFHSQVNAPMLKIPEEAWGNGTCISESLYNFVMDFSWKVLTKDTVVVIVSDGLDAGNSKNLDWAMNEIKIKSKTIIWINPLLAINGYEPLAKAMRICLPYIDHFTSLDEFLCRPIKT